MTTLVISNEEINNIMKILQSLQESSLLIEGISEEITNEQKDLSTDFKYIIKYMRCYFIRKLINN